LGIVVSHFGTPDAPTNPIGYQTVLYVTIALYIVALILSLVLVKPTDKALEAKAAKKAAK
jgi:OFA family oxalate/formate antiporter-like MFS transporter